MINTLKDTNNSWTKRPFSVKLKDKPMEYKEILDTVLEPDPDDPGSAAAVANGYLNQNAPDLEIEPNFTDTRVGGCDTMNPYWAFCENDDIIHPATSTDNGMCNRGLGRCYHEMYHQNEQVLWLSFGIPQYCDLADFYAESVDQKLADIMNRGNGTSASKTILGSLGGFIGAAGKLLISIPFAPLIIMSKVVNAIHTKQITKYYEYKSAMPLYYQMVNTVLAPLAVALGLTPNGDGGGDSSGGMNEGNLTKQMQEGGIPNVLKDGPDIFKIMGRRASRTNLGKDNTTEDILKKYGNHDTSEFGDTFWEMLKGNSLGASDYVGFRIEKSTDSSESVSNSVGDSSIVSSLNSTAASAADKNFSLQGGQTGITALDAVIGGVADFTKGLVSGMGMDAATTLITGNGRYDIPQVWKESSFSKSYNFTFTLRARAGDPVSYYQSILIPLACILAGALPRSIGKNTYTSPFLCQAYCKGMFSVNIGMIESVSIKRGSAEFGWTFNNLPTVIEVSMTIKDLSPAMFASLGTATAKFSDIWAANTNFHDYLDTLSGLGIEERVFFLQRLERNWKTCLNTWRNTYSSPAYWAQNLSKYTRVAGALSPWSAMPE